MSDSSGTWVPMSDLAFQPLQVLFLSPTEQTKEVCVALGFWDLKWVELYG